MQGRTPRTISPPIRALCRELVADPEPRFLDVAPLPRAEVNDCFAVVARHVEAHGGSVVYGWAIWEWPPVLIEAEFHAVWRAPTGELREITPKQIPVSRILFLPDPGRVYEGRQVSNVRRPLTPHPQAAEFIRACEAEFEFMNRGARALQHGAIELSGVEAAEHQAIQFTKARLLQEILSSQPSRNAPCPCGSGKKFKRCHGQSS